MLGTPDSASSWSPLRSSKSSSQMAFASLQNLVAPIHQPRGEKITESPTLPVRCWPTNQKLREWRPWRSNVILFACASTPRSVPVNQSLLCSPRGCPRTTLQNLWWHGAGRGCYNGRMPRYVVGQLFQSATSQQSSVDCEGAQRALLPVTPKRIPKVHLWMQTAGHNSRQGKT